MAPKVVGFAVVESRRRNWLQRLLRRPTGRVVVAGEIKGGEPNISSTQTPLYLELSSIGAWERECDRSLAESRRRRKGSPHPWPERGHRLAAALIAVVAVVVILLLIAGAWAIA